ncbi:pyridine nucleotide-disulfide oxidoreductase [Spirochaetia bacterium]|nr:pyridine nucleotide-disulfide oxidoreductase [Spirochaetia bacterium]
MNHYDVAVIGGGPAGLAAALQSEKQGAKTLLIERENRLGGILKQCIHDGFGLVRFGEKLSGPEYAYRFQAPLEGSAVEKRLLTFVSRARKIDTGFELTLASGSGMETVRSGVLVLATGCRERTARQIGVHGTRPAGVLTAGSAQYYTNILGQLPARRCVILGSGDIGLIMARRLTLEGATVPGVYEAKQTPSGLSRNIAQCLDDFNIPLYTGRTVTRVFGRQRVEAVEVCSVNEFMQPITGTEECIPCDTLILSVGLIPENELAEKLGVPLSPETKGPICDQNGMTMVDGIFCAGNALLVNDLVDYVSESGENAGRNAAFYAAATKRPVRRFAAVNAGAGFLCVSPQRIDMAAVDAAGDTPVTVFFRAAAERGKTRVKANTGGKEIFNRTYRHLRPPEMERVELKISNVQNGEITFVMESEE